MKICIATNSRPHEGGMTTLINALAQGFRTLNHEVDIINIFGVSQQQTAKNDLVKVTDKILYNSNWRTILAYKLSKVILFLYLYINYLKKRYDIIYAADESIVNLGQWIKKIHKVPIILTVQSSILKDLINQNKITKDSYATKYFLNEEIKGARNADCIISASTYSKNYVESITSKHTPIFVIKNFIDEELFYPDKKNQNQLKKEFGVPLDKFIIFCPARLVERKGVIYPLLAMTILAKKDPQYFLVYVGEGPEKETLLKLIKQHGLENHVKFLGTVPFRKLGRFYNISDVVVAPSITIEGQQEPYGLTPLEAMACGVPAIASDMGGYKENIRNGLTGLLVPERDYEALANSIHLIKNNPELKQKLVNNGLREISQNYTKAKVTSEIINIFSKYINKK